MKTKPLAFLCDWPIRTLSLKCLWDELSSITSHHPNSKQTLYLRAEYNNIHCKLLVCIIKSQNTARPYAVAATIWNETRERPPIDISQRCFYHFDILGYEKAKLAMKRQKRKKPDGGVGAFFVDFDVVSFVATIFGSGWTKRKMIRFDVIAAHAHLSYSTNIFPKHLNHMDYCWYGSALGCGASDDQQTMNSAVRLDVQWAIARLMRFVFPCLNFKSGYLERSWLACTNIRAPSVCEKKTTTTTVRSKQQFLGPQHMNGPIITHEGRVRSHFDGGLLWVSTCPTMFA